MRVVVRLMMATYLHALGGIYRLIGRSLHQGMCNRLPTPKEEGLKPGKSPEKTQQPLASKRKTRAILSVKTFGQNIKS